MTDTPPEGPAARAAADRRRVLDVALDRRPDMTIADLHEALTAIGIDVDTATLVADLDALGFVVDDVAPPAAADVAPPAGAEAPPATDVAPTADAAAPTAPPPAPGPAPWWQGRAGVAALAVAVLVVALVVAAVVGGGDDEVADGDGTTSVPTTAPGAEPGSDATSTTTAPAPPPTAPAGPGEDPELAGGVDGLATFDEPSAEGLGTAPDGTPWTVAGGTWSVADGAARLDAVDGAEGVGLATFDPGLTSYRLQVRVASVVDGNGLVFGAAGVDDHYALTFAADYATFVLARVRDGEVEPMGNTDLTSTPEGRAVIGVHVTPGQVEVLVGGAVALTVEVDEPAGTAMGLGSLAGSAGGTYDEVSYRADP